MRRVFLAVMFLANGDFSLAATPQPEASRTPHPQQAQPPQAACTDTRSSADYVPGVDAYGRPVAPADLPGSTTDVEISTQVYVEMGSRNPQMRGVGVTANLPGLQTRPPTCAQLAPPSIVIH